MNKRKRSDDEEESELSDLEASDVADDEADVQEDYSGPKPKPKAKPQEKGPVAENAAPKRRGRPPGKKARVAKPAVPGAPKQRKARARKAGADFDAEQLTKETKINNDNPLFSAFFRNILQQS